MIFDPGPVLSQLVSDVKEAWSIESVYDGRQIFMPAEPYAIVRLDNVPMEFSGARVVEQLLKFEVIGRFPRTPQESVELRKYFLVAELAKKLTAGTTYANGLLPLITLAEFEESDDPAEPVLEVGIQFQVVIEAAYFG